MRIVVVDCSNNVLPRGLRSAVVAAGHELAEAYVTAHYSGKNRPLYWAEKPDAVVLLQEDSDVFLSDVQAMRLACSKAGIPAFVANGSEWFGLLRALAEDHQRLREKLAAEFGEHHDGEKTRPGAFMLGCSP